MKRLFLVLFSLFLFVQTFAQLQEVGQYDDYALSSAIALKDRVFLYKHDGYNQGYYTTTDFQTFTPASYPFEDAYLGQFVKDGELYFITRMPYVANPQYILRLNEQNDFDTVSTFSLALYASTEILGTTPIHVYFRATSTYFRLNFQDSTVNRLKDVPNTNLFHTNFAITDTSLVLHSSTDNVFGQINVMNDIFESAKIDLNEYSFPKFFPQMRHNGGFLFTHFDSVANNYGAFFTNGDTVLASYTLPQPVDTFWQLAPDRALTYRIYYEPNYTSFKYNFNQNYLLATREKRLPNLRWTYKLREAWWYFDSINDSFVLIDDTTEFIFPYSTWRDWMLFDLKEGKAGYGHYKNSGLEIIGFEGNQKKLLKDTYPGMGSGILLGNSWGGKYFDYVTHNGLLYVYGWHPYWGHSLYRSDGSEEGTGIVGAIGERFASIARTRMFPINNKVFVYVRYDFNHYVYEVNHQSPFIKEPPLRDKSSFWNRSIYQSIYGTSSGSGGRGKARSAYKSGLVLQQSEHIYNDYFAYPEDKTYSQLINEDHPYGASTITIHDTIGNLLHNYVVKAYRSQATLTHDSTIVLFIKHEDESRTSFDTILTSGERTYLDKYTLQKKRIERTILPFNFEVYKLETSKDGFIYITGLYEDKELRLSNIRLTSTKSKQYFIAAFNNNLQPVWAKNIKLPETYELSSFTDITDIFLEEESTTIYTIFNEGWVHWNQENGDHLWQGTIQAFNSITGEELFQTVVQSEGTSVFRAIAKTKLDELWLAGTLNKASTINGEALDKFASESAGSLIVLDAKSGKLKKSYAKPGGNYLEIASKNNSVYAIWYSREKELSGEGIASEDKNFSLNFEQRDLSGILQSEYVNPIRMWDREMPSFELYPEINNKKDWLCFSVIEQYGPLSDSLHFPNISLTAYFGNTLLMRRPGQIFKDLPTQNLAGWNPKEPVAYPNPVTNGNVFIGSLQQDVVYNAYELLGLDGRVIDRGTIDQVQWPLRLKFPPGLQGIYILRLDGANQSKSFKLVFDSKR